jgi:hypothetical protein
VPQQRLLQVALLRLHTQAEEVKIVKIFQ